MKNQYSNHINCGWLRSFLFLVIVCSSQVYSFHHLDHYHDVDLLQTEKNVNPDEAAVEYSTDHHHDENAQDSGDHQHTYTKHLDWHISRVQNPRGLTLDHQYPSASIVSYVTISSNRSSVVNRDILYIDGDYFPTIYVRGPPLSA